VLRANVRQFLTQLPHTRLGIRQQLIQVLGVTQSTFNLQEQFRHTGLVGFSHLGCLGRVPASATHDCSPRIDRFAPTAVPSSRKPPADDTSGTQSECAARAAAPGRCSKRARTWDRCSVLRLPFRARRNPPAHDTRGTRRHGKGCREEWPYVQFSEPCRPHLSNIGRHRPLILRY